LYLRRHGDPLLLRSGLFANIRIDGQHRKAQANPGKRQGPCRQRMTRRDPVRPMIRRHVLGVWHRQLGNGRAELGEPIFLRPVQLFVQGRISVPPHRRGGARRGIEFSTVSGLGDLEMSCLDEKR